MGKEKVISLIDVQLKSFNDIVDRLQRELKMSFKKIDQHVSNVIKSLEFFQAEIADITAKLDLVHKEKQDCQSELSLVMEYNDELKNQLKELKYGKMDYLDD